ncbi:MAG: hypothetical protein ACKN9T_13070 [Candidatus Methylumidiphilus sp.]
MLPEPSPDEIERAQVMSLRRLGLLASEIALRLDMSLHQVKKHLANGPRRFQRSTGVSGPVTAKQQHGTF